MRKNLLLLLGFLCGVTMIYAQNVVDFEELSLDPESHWNGSDGSGQFTSGYLKFYNSFTDWGGGATSWNGFAYTNETDATTLSYTNEFSSAHGEGVWSSESYAVSYIMGDWMNDYHPVPSAMKIDTESAPEEIPGMFISLNAYSSLYMADNDFYPNGEHWLRLHIAAYSTSTWYATSADILLADYRFDNSNLDFKMEDWAYIDLSWADGTDSLLFYIYSSDAGEYGVNTPAYFCIDNVGEECPIGIPQLETEILGDYFIQSGSSANISAFARGGVQPYTFEWSNEPGLDNYYSQTPLASPEVNTSYYVTVTDAYGDENTGIVNVWIDEVGISQNNTFKPVIYLNSEILVIESEQIIDNVKILDITGKLIIETEPESAKTSLNLSFLPNGMYLVQTSDGISCSTQKILK
jgi:hypothetical protein